MAATAKRDRRLREERLGFRVDEPTKALIEGAAQLERRKLADDLGSFASGVESLDRHPKSQAGEDVRRKPNAVFILSEIGEPTRILGYYTLCAMATSQGDVPETARKLVPGYPLVSATFIGRLAVAKDRQDSVWARSFSSTHSGGPSRAPARLGLRW